MKKLLIVFFVLALVAAINPLCAQPMKWKVVAPNVLQVVKNGGVPTGLPQWGAIKVHNQTVLAGWRNMVLSTDGGLTWTTMNAQISSEINDIDIYDDQTFAFITEYDAYYSNNKGATWTKIPSAISLGKQILYDGSPQKILFSDELSGLQLFTIGGSAKSLPIPNYPSIIGVHHAADGSLRAVGYNPPSEGFLFSSMDDGMNWQISLPVSGGDNYSFIADQLDPSRFVIVNEDYYLTTDNYADLYLTTNNGQSWQHPYSKPLKTNGALCGNSAVGCHDYFVGTIGNGILRSADKGVTWQSIGGPPTAIDSRLLAAADDSLLFAIDTLGSIWATDAQPSISASISGSEFFGKLNIARCDTSLSATIHFSGSSCIGIGIASLQLIGTDSSEYTITGNLSKPFAYPDSIRIGFTPIHSGKTDTHLQVLYANGTSVIVDLSVNVSPAALNFSRSALFEQDSIFICSTDSASLFLSALCPLDLSSISIIGIDAASFILAGKDSASLPADSLVKIRCIPKHLGNLSAILHLVASDGRTWDVPLNPFAEITPLEFQPAALFSLDTIASCQNDSTVLILSSPCSLDLTSISITGVDAASFILQGKNSASLPIDSLIKIICIPQHSGKLGASLHIIARDGRTWDIPINPFAGPTPLQFQPASPFGNDTIKSCSSDSAQVILSAPCALDLSSLAITGADAASFIIAGKNSASLPADSVIKILCLPQHSGKLSAVLHIIASDGRTWDIPLNLFITEPPLEFQPLSLFAHDSLEFCSVSRDSILMKALCSLDLVSISIAGVDATSFVLLSKPSALLPFDSIIAVICVPQHPGLLTASLHLVSAGGTAWDVPISPFIKPTPTIAFDQTSITNAFTDVVGGDVSIPIVIIHTGSPGNVSFTIHYDMASLVYRGAFDILNADHTTGHPDNHSARITFNSNSDTIIFARFLFFPVDSACTHITIDSLTGISQCLYILANSADAEICSPAACGYISLARFLRYGMMPQLGVIPNPSSGSFTITSSEPLGFVTISVTDQLGIVRAIQTSELSPAKNAKLSLESLPSGIYYVRITGLASALPIVLVK